MARDKTLKVVITGDADRLDREIRKSNNSLDKLGKQTRLTSSVTSKGFAGMRVAAVGATAALGGLAIVGKKVVDAAIESEKAQARLQAQLKASGISYATHGKEIDAVIQKHSKLAGLDDEALTDAFTNIVRVTGDVDKSMRLVGLAADFARAKNLDAAKAGEIVGKVAGGNIGVLSRYGIQVEKGATATEALGLLQQKFAGQAEAYGKTTGGSIDRAGVAFENLQETIGQAAAPAIEDLANKTADFVNEMQDGTGAGGRFADKLKDIWAEAKPIVTWIGRAIKNVAEFASEHPKVAKLAAAVVGVGLAVKGLKFASAATGFTDLLKMGRSTMKRLTRTVAAEGAVAGTAGGSAISTGMLAGDRFGKAGTKGGRRFGRMLGRGAVAGIALGLITLGPELIAGVIKIVKDIKWPKIKLPFGLGSIGGDGLGRGALPKGGGGNLMGASSALGPFASVGRQHGLSVSSGLRPGAITKSGNQSHHASGRAIDMSGPPAKMLAYFRAMKARFGGVLSELIYTPGGTGIKNGRPHRYTGAVAADHYDHVHVAYGGGDGEGRRPGTGDGYGKGSIMNLWTKAGGSAGVANLAAAVALAESGGESSASNRNSDGSIDRGLWQINSVHGKLSTFDPMGNARAAVKISSGGKNWSPWVAWKKGMHKKFLDDAGSVTGGARSVRSSGNTEQAGSRIVNALTGRYSPGIDRAMKAATRTGSLMEDASTAYGQLERRFGQSEEDLGTAAGREKRIGEIEALKGEKGKQLARALRRATHLKNAVSRYDKLIKDARKKRDKAKGASRARIVKRIRDFEDKRTDVAAELKSIRNETIPDLQLDLGDLDKDIADVAATEDTAGEAPESATDILSRTLGDIDAQERAGVITPESAQAQRIAYLQRAIAGEFGGMSQRELWDTMGQLREVQQQAAQATVDNTSALRDLQKSIEESNAIANSTIGIQLREAQRAFGDLLTGELGGRVATRAYMPGSGQLTRL